MQVKAVEPNVLVLADKKTGEERRIDFGVCVWCTGALRRPLGSLRATHHAPVIQASR